MSTKCSFNAIILTQTILTEFDAQNLLAASALKKNPSAVDQIALRNLLRLVYATAINVKAMNIEANNIEVNVIIVNQCKLISKNVIFGPVFNAKRYAFLPCMDKSKGRTAYYEDGSYVTFPGGYPTKRAGLVTHCC